MMSNYSNSGHQVPHHDSSSQHNNAFFNDSSFGGYDGYLNHNATDGFDQEWNYNPEQFSIAGNATGVWPDAGSQQHVQPQGSFRPGAQPDQPVFASSSLSNIPNKNSDLGYSSSHHNLFANFPHHQQFSTTTISPSNLDSQSGQVQVRVPTPSASVINSATIAPEALSSARYSKASALSLQIPSGVQNGDFTVISPRLLRQNNSTRGIAAFVEVENYAVDFPFLKGTVIPPYYPRKSRNDIKRLVANNSSLKANVNKKVAKKSALIGVQSRPAKFDPTGKPVTQLRTELSESSTEESSDSSEYESSGEEDAPSKPPIPATRPSNPNEATRHDTIKCLWRPKHSAVSAERIRDGLKGFHEILTTIKERWKSDNNAVKQAEDAKKESELPLLKERVKIQRDMLEVALKAACEHGHPDIIDHFGTSVPGVGTLAVFLQDRTQNLDHSGSLVVAIVEFLSRCKMLDTAVMEKSKIGKLLARFAKRGDDKVKTLVKRIESNAVLASKKKKETSKPITSSNVSKDATKTDSSAKLPPSAAVTAGSGVKRGAAVKKVAPSVVKAGEATAGAKKTAAGIVASTASKPTANTTNKTTTSQPVVAKSPSFISSLQSAKRPQPAKPASSAAKAAPKPSESKTPPQPGSFLSSVLADIKRPQEQKSKDSKQNDKRATETPEEKAKRLRKESRRGLRVSFKPQDSLVEVRIFEHDPEEELGHDTSQVRDVNDVRSEGTMFKLHQQHQEMLDIEDDEDEYEVVEHSWREWREPPAVNFTDIPEETRSDNYAPYGGGEKEPECPEKQAQEEREASTLVVVYSTRTDIPATPVEADRDADGMVDEPQEFGKLPTDHFVLERIADIEKRNQTLTNPFSPPQDVSAILAALAGNAGPSTVAQAVSQMQATSVTQPSMPSSQDLASVFNSLQNPQFHQQAPAPPMAPPPLEMASILSAMNSSNQQPQQNPSSGEVDVSSILASLQQPGPPPQGAPQMPMPFMGMPSMPGQPAMDAFNANDPNMMSMMQQAHQFASQGMPNMPSLWGQQPPQSGPVPPFENAERKRMREQGDQGERQGKFRKNGKVDSSKFFQVQCKYYKEGKCVKGAACTYRHDDD